MSTLFLLPLLLLSTSTAQGEQYNLVVDVKESSFLRAFEDLRPLFTKWLRHHTYEYTTESVGVHMRAYEFALSSVDSIGLIRHNGHYHLKIRNMRGSFGGRVSLYSAIHERTVPWNRTVTAHILIGPINIIALHGLPYIQHNLHCKARVVPVIRVSRAPSSSVSSVTSSVVHSRMPVVASDELLLCDLAVKVLDNVLREQLALLHLKIPLPTGYMLEHSLTSPPLLVSPPSSSPLLRFLFSSRSGGMPSLHSPPLPPRMDPTHPLHPAPADILHLARLSHPPHHRLRRDHPVDRLVDHPASLPVDHPESRPVDHPDSLQKDRDDSLHRHAVHDHPYDVTYHIEESVFQEAARSLCVGGFMDGEFSLERKENMSLSFKCMEDPTVDFSELPASWRFTITFPFLFKYNNGKAVTEKSVKKKAVLSIQNDDLMFTFHARFALTNENEPGRYIFSNLVANRIVSQLQKYYSLPLPFIAGFHSHSPAVSVHTNRIVFATNFTNT